MSHPTSSFLVNHNNEDNEEPPVRISKGKGKRTVIPDTEDEGSEPDSEPAAESAEAELSML